jgi:hypothetical protein
MAVEIRTRPFRVTYATARLQTLDGGCSRRCTTARRIAAAEAPVMFQADGRTVPAHVAFDHRVDVLRDLRKAGWTVLEVWVAEPGNRGHARRRFSAAQAHCAESGREALELIVG